MNFSSQQIETIIHSVMQELLARGVDVRRRQRAAHTEQPAAASHTTAAATALVISGKVITEDSLTAAQAAGRSVQFQAGAIVTPSGHDFIRRHQVTLAGTAPSALRAHKADNLTQTGIVVAQNCSAANSAAQTAGWTLVTAGCERDAARSCLQSAATRSANPPEDQTERIVCCVGVPAATACLLNRRSSVRAAVLDPAGDAGQLLTAMNPHVLCLESSRWSFTALLRLLKQVARIPLSVPADWEEV